MQKNGKYVEKLVSIFIFIAAIIYNAYLNFHASVKRILIFLMNCSMYFTLWVFRCSLVKVYSCHFGNSNYINNNKQKNNNKMCKKGDISNGY